jgi:hypothetical protein
MCNEEEKRRVACKDIKTFHLGPTRLNQESQLGTACYHQITKEPCPNKGLPPGEVNMHNHRSGQASSLVDGTNASGQAHPECSR